MFFFSYINHFLGLVFALCTPHTLKILLGFISGMDNDSDLRLSCMQSLSFGRGPIRVIETACFDAKVQ